MEIKHKRKQIRLKHYDYAQYGCYFVTICTKDRKHIFGEIENYEMKLNPFGLITKDTLLSLLETYIQSEIPYFVIMPNHLHFIWFNQNDISLMKIVRLFKGRTTALYRQYLKQHYLEPESLWQRSFYEHIIRDDKDYLRIVEYIENNPLQWDLDRFNQA